MSEYQNLLDMRNGENCPRGLAAIGTIIGGVVHEAQDARRAARLRELETLWRSAGVRNAYPRSVRMEFIREASNFVTEGDG